MSCKCGKEVDCPCPKTECENHSKCCECVANHMGKDLIPFCLRPKDE